MTLDDDLTLCIENNLKLQNCPHKDPYRDHPVYKLNKILCPQFNQITVLEIRKVKLREVPEVIKNLNLTELILSSNSLEKVPSFLYTGLDKLELLDLSHNLIENFDMAPACIQKIVTLNVSYNLIKNFPEWILILPCNNLKNVIYTRNFLKMLELKHTLYIKKLEMRNSQMVNEDFPFLQKLTSLEYLDISNEESTCNENQFKDISVLFVKVKWKNMKILKLNNLTISVLPKNIFFVTTLTELHLANCNLHWIPEEIHFLENLEVLDVSGNSLCSLSLHVTNLPLLKIVRAPFNFISSVSEFTSSLTTLDLYNNSLEENSLNINRTDFIDLEQNYFNTDNLKFCEIYKSKRDSFREMCSLTVRINGPKSQSDLEYESSESDATEYSLEEKSTNESISENSCEKFNIIEDDECWDSVEPPKTKSSTNPEITPSDDEWDGRINEIRTAKKSTLHFWLDADEDWIFSDAEED